MEPVEGGPGYTGRGGVHAVDAGDEKGVVKAWFGSRGL